MYTPSRDEFLAASGQGNLIPVYRELLADGDTPVSAYAALGASEHSFLLESVVGGSTWAAYSFVGVAPRAVVRWRDGIASVTWYDVDSGGPPRTAEWATPDPTAALAEVLGELRPVDVPGLPRFWGGAVGWISYDCVRAFEELPGRARPALDLPPLCMVITDTLLIFDNLRQTLKVLATPYFSRPERAEAAYDRACERIDAVIATLRKPRRALPSLTPPRLGEARGDAVPPSSFSKADFLTAVDKVKDYILAGDAFQVVLSQRFSEPVNGARPLDVYRALRVINPSPYMFHLEFPEARVTGASPETLVRLCDGRVELRPIAGTRPRGTTIAEDDRFAEELLADPKECAEHLMLIDLGRNDVGRVAEVGSVQVAEKMVIERYSHVMHMTSHVVGKLAKGRTWLDVLRAAFPAGTLSGAPKIRAMEIIDELEPHERGIYGGAVGYVSYTGNLDLAIAIRTLVSHGDTIYVQAGAGLVADSVPELEYQETVNKARAVLRAVAMARTATEEPVLKLLLIDNYDSFTWNIAQYFGELGAEVTVERNDAITIDAIRERAPDAIVISPGPCTPNEAGISMDVIKTFAGATPILGVCLGHQCIGQVFGGKIVRAPRIMHGKTSKIFHDEKGLYAGVENPFVATRYHSLVIAPETMPDTLEVTSKTWEDEIMGVRLKARGAPLEGVQFHPESIMTTAGKALLKNFLAMAKA